MRCFTALSWSQQTDPNNNVVSQSQIQYKHRINDGLAFQETLQNNKTHLLEPSIRHDVDGDPQKYQEKIDEMIQQFTFNREQAHTFRIITEHSLDSKKNH